MIEVCFSRSYTQRKTADLAGSAVFCSGMKIISVSIIFQFSVCHIFQKAGIRDDLLPFLPGIIIDSHQYMIVCSFPYCFLHLFIAQADLVSYIAFPGMRLDFDIFLRRRICRAVCHPDIPSCLMIRGIVRVFQPHGSCLTSISTLQQDPAVRILADGQPLLSIIIFYAGQDIFFSQYTDLSAFLSKGYPLPDPSSPFPSKRLPPV